MPEPDTKPWYRQFWPWFLIALPATAVVGSLYTLSLAVRTTDSLVVIAENEGVDVVAQRHLAAEQQARDLGLTAVVEVDRRAATVRADLGRTAAVDAWPPTLELRFSHPAFAELDHSVTLARLPASGPATAAFSGQLGAVPEGRYYLVLRHGDRWRLNGTWNGAGPVRLGPARAGSDGET